LLVFPLDFRSSGLHGEGKDLLKKFRRWAFSTSALCVLIGVSLVVLFVPTSLGMVGFLPPCSFAFWFYSPLCRYLSL